MKKRFKKIYIEITNICNLSCSFCTPNNRRKEYMDLNNFNYILSQIEEYTDYIYLHVKGEPLMHPNINEIIELAGQKGFFVNITTNGTLMDLLHNKNIRQINYSMQSTEDVEKIRLTIKKIRSFIKDTNIYLSLRLWSEQSKNNIKLKEMLLEEFKLSNGIDTLTDNKKIADNIYLSIESEFTWPDINSNNESEEGYCYGLKDHIAILVDGTVVPCCLDNNGDIELGNIYTDNLKSILESQRSQKIITGFQNRKISEELCKKCNYKDKF